MHGILKKKIEMTDPKVVESATKTAVRIRKESTGDPPSDVSLLNSPSEPVSILRRKSSRDDLEPSRVGTPEPHSILKRPPSRDESLELSRSLSPEPHSILKKKAAFNLDSESDPRPILKKPSFGDEGNDPRPILKKKSSTDDERDFADKPRPILKINRR